LAQDSGFEEIILDSIVALNYLKLNDLSLDKYFYWRVRIKNYLGEGIWSNVARFKRSTPSKVEPLRLRTLEIRPNPISSSVVFSFALPKTSFVNLKLFNALGQEVATLIDHTLSMGNNQAAFNTQGLSSGIYTYQLRIDDLFETGHVVVRR
jgi:hypothetical protein